MGKVKITKTGATTIFEKNGERHFFNKEVNYMVNNGTLRLRAYEEKDLIFSFDDIEDPQGATNINEYANFLATNKYFTGIENE